MDSNDRARLRRERTLSRQLQLGAFGRHGMTLIAEAASLRDSENIVSWQLRAGRRTRARLEALRFEIDENEMLAGRVVTPVFLPWQLEEAKAYLAGYPGSPGQTGHCEPYLNDLFRLGIDDLGETVAARARNATGETADFYASCLTALEGFSQMIENVAATVTDAMGGATPSRREELAVILDSCRHIAHHPPRNFRDAIQLLWLTMVGIMSGDNVGLVGPGRIDRLLCAYYRPEEAVALELIEALYLLINDYQGPSVAYAVMVGGTDASDAGVANELSYLGLEAIRRTGLTYPTVGVCYHSGMPSALSKLAVELIAQGYATPAFFNDEMIVRGMLTYGVPEAEAHDYINSTCVEITPCGSSNVWVASPYFNLCGILLEHLAATAENPPATFEDFTAGYYARLGRQIEAAAVEQNQWREQRRLYGRKPLQSVFTRDCLTRGRDIDDGGARYNWVECSFVGLANLVDSLTAIRAAVFSEKSLSLKSLKMALDADFAGAEPLRHKLLHYPKYGNDDRTVDALIPPLMARISAECDKWKMAPDQAPFVPGVFCWIKHQQLGAVTGATPDGRSAGFAFADGAGPAQGREVNGPTAGIRSVTGWDHHALIGGSAYNMKFSKKLFSEPEKQDKLQALVETFLRCGGFETQVNVVDRDTLQHARTNPDLYRDLVVRIGGYTDYFTNLSPGMQDEVIQRTEFSEL